MSPKKRAKVKRPQVSHNGHVLESAVVTPHNLLAAAFLVLLKMAKPANLSFEVRPEIRDANIWVVTVTDWEFHVFMDLEETDYIERIKGPGDIDLDLHDHELIDDAWVSIFANLIRLDDIASRVVARCRVHPEWPYAVRK